MYAVWVVGRVVIFLLRKGILEDVVDGIFYNGFNKIFIVYVFFITLR